MSKKKSKKQAHESLKEFDIRINEFGEIIHSFDIDKVNEFLNENTKDWRIQAENETGKTSVKANEEEGSEEE